MFYRLYFYVIDRLEVFFEDRTKLTQFTYAMGIMTGILVLSFYQNEQYIKMIVVVLVSYFVLQRFNKFFVPIKEAFFQVNFDEEVEDNAEALKRGLEEFLKDIEEK